MFTPQVLCAQELSEQAARLRTEADGAQRDAAALHEQLAELRQELSAAQGAAGIAREEAQRAQRAASDTAASHRAELVRLESEAGATRHAEAAAQLRETVRELEAQLAEARRESEAVRREAEAVRRDAEGGERQLAEARQRAEAAERAAEAAQMQVCSMLLTSAYAGIMIYNLPTFVHNSPTYTPAALSVVSVLWWMTFLVCCVCARAV